MSLDELALGVQRLVDRAVRRLRLGAAPARGRRRLLIVQIDGLSRSALEQGLAEGRMPFLSRLLQRHGYGMHRMSVGLPSSTPAFQMSAMYGVRPDIPGFHYHDKRRRADVYFPRAGDAAWVERTQAAGRRGILEGGSAYGCVFTGGAVNNLFTFAAIKRPSGAGFLRGASAFVVLGWVLVKGTVLGLLDVVRAALRFVADPVGEAARGWRWIAIKVGISVWIRQFFTLAVSRDLYRGVPAIYVNYLDYDVFAHVYGPRHRRALRALRRIDRSIHQLWRIIRRLPERGYDLYVLSDHGQMACTPYVELPPGRPIERVLTDDILEPAGAAVMRTHGQSARGAAGGFRSWRSRWAPGVFQRFLNHLEEESPWLLGELPEARERASVRVVAAGPNVFVYFLETPQPVGIEWVDQRWPGLADEISRTRGIGFVLARGGAGPLCIVRGKRSRLHRDEPGPFAAIPGAALVIEGIADLMAMPCAGDLVIYGNDASDGNVSYVRERGAHAGPSTDEMETFIVTPPGVQLPGPISHPTQLYPLFARYQAA
jgi:hypothetical protein